MAAVASQSHPDIFSQDGDLLDLFRQATVRYGDVSESELQEAYKQLLSEPGGSSALAARLRCHWPPKQWKYKEMLSGTIQFTPVKADFLVNNKSAAIQVDGEAVGYFFPQSTQVYGYLYFDELRALYGRRNCTIYTTWTGGRKEFVVDIYDDSRNLIAKYKVLDPPFDVDSTSGKVNITRP